MVIRDGGNSGGSGGMTKGQGEPESLVFVVDDDASVRQALTSLLQSIGLQVESFGSAADEVYATSRTRRPLGQRLRSLVYLAMLRLRLLLDSGSRVGRGQ